MSSVKTKVDTILEFAGYQYPITELEKYAKKIIKEKYSEITIKEIGIYLQPETNFIFFTVNGEGTPEDCFSFDDFDLYKEQLKVS